MNTLSDIIENGLRETVSLDYSGTFTGLTVTGSTIITMPNLQIYSYSR